MEIDEDFLNDLSEDLEWEQNCLNQSRTSDKDVPCTSANSQSREDAPTVEHLDVLQKCFGHSSFRPMQWKIIHSILYKRRDNCVVMATGYGKSLCFQFPSVYCGGVTIVISPLISLMEDQVLALQILNIPACLLGSAQTKQNTVISDIMANKYNLVYMTPEFCTGDSGKQLLQNMNKSLSLTLIAIDEAHCVSTWGHDFRYQYRELGKLRDILPEVPILAVTATATPRVRNDIVSSLKLRNPQVLCLGFDRPNLFFEVRMKGKSGIFNDIRSLMVREDEQYTFCGPTIIYTITRKMCEELAEELKVKDIDCGVYHAGLPLKKRKEIHELFVRDKIKIVVATIAFGMGIDKPDVRYVIHYGCSKDIESYYQEVGRAGRDGQPSKCITFYNNQDFKMHELLREHSSRHVAEKKQDMAKIMKQYLETRGCRRRFILTHFEGPSLEPDKPRNNCCDNCNRRLYDREDTEKYEGLNSEGCYDFTADSNMFLEIVGLLGGKFGVGKYVNFLRGCGTFYAKYKESSSYGCGKHKSPDWWKSLAKLLESEGFLMRKKIDKGPYNCEVVELTTKANNFLKSSNSTLNGKKLLLKPVPEMFKLLKLKAQPRTTSQWLGTQNGDLVMQKVPLQKMPVPQLNSITLSDEDSNLYKLLLNKRSEIASLFNCMPYMVASNEALMQMAKLRPTTLTELRDCHLNEFNENKLKRFGEDFLTIVRSQTKSPTPSTSFQKKSILDILRQKPLCNAVLSPTALNTYSSYKKGFTIKEISEQRGLNQETVASHLIDAMKTGYLVKLIDFNITPEMKKKIAEVACQVSPNLDLDAASLPKIKNHCGPDVLYYQIGAVTCYLKIRRHLESLGADYEEFEDLEQDSLHSSQNESNALQRLIEIAGDIKKEKNHKAEISHGTLLENSLLESPKASRHSSRDSTPDLEDILETPHKKQKVDKTIIESETVTTATQENKESTAQNKESITKKFVFKSTHGKKVLPSWLH